VAGDPVANTTGNKSQDKAKSAPEKDEEPAVEDGPTVAQANAIAAAEMYVDTMPFSRDGLIEQLSSEAGSGFSKADAIYAVNHIDVDWNAEAVEAAQSYVDTMPFSRDALIEQLESEAGSGFTHAQAVYAVNQTGL
jgi:predicted 3-demethylubiquinone-9 3-methyltransferase (glyoxalase superfamily)